MGQFSFRWSIFFNDGLAFTAFVRQARYRERFMGYRTIVMEILPKLPAKFAAFGGEFKIDSGHTEWVDARVHQTDFTTTFSPNQVVPHAVKGVTLLKSSLNSAG